MTSVYLEQDPRFYNRLVEVAHNVGLSPEDMLVVMTLESGINPSVNNGNYGGLVQMSNSTLKGLGFDGNVVDFSGQPAFKQLDYIEKHINRLRNWIGGSFSSAEQYYLGNLLPAALKLQGVRDMNPDTVIMAKNPTEPHLPNVTINKEKIYYSSNAGLDRNKDGKITYGDIEVFLEKKRTESHYTNAITQLGKTNYTPPAAAENSVSGTGFLKKIEELLNNLMATASEDSMLTNDFTISIIGPDLDTSIEFSRVLAMSLREELRVQATLHQQNNLIEVTCSIDGPYELSEKIINSFTQHITDCFYERTQKIGGIRVNASIKGNRKSSYKNIDFKTATMSYRKFLTKFI